MQSASGTIGEDLKHLALHFSSCYFTYRKNGQRHDKRLLDKADIVRHIPSKVTLWADTGFHNKRQASRFLMPYT